MFGCMDHNTVRTLYTLYVCWALYAAGVLTTCCIQVVATLSPARLAGAMTGGTRAGSIDSVLMEQLQWLQSWAADAASNDVDVQCQQLASACGNLQGGLAAQALESLEAGSQNVQQSLPGLPNMQSPAMLIDAVQLGTLKL